MKNKTVVLTGSTGMIGLAIINKLIALDCNVIAFIRKKSAKTDLLPKSDKVKIVECDLSELSSYLPQIKADYFIHLGWDKTIGDGRDDCYTQNLNVKYTLDAVMLAKRFNCMKFLGIGSQAEYGLHNEDLTIDTCCNPLTGYGIAKYAAGKMAKIMCDKEGLLFNWIRVLSVYGEHDNPNTLISYIKKCISEDIDPEVSLCEQMWDYIEVNDAADVIIKIMYYGNNGVSYPLGSGRGRILKSYIEDMIAKSGSKIKVKYGAKAYQKNQVMHLVADMSYLDDFNGEIK